MISDEVFIQDIPRMTYSEFGRKHGISVKNARKRSIKLGLIPKKYEITQKHKDRISSSNKKTWDSKEDPVERLEKTKENRRIRSNRRRKERWNDSSDNFKDKKRKLYQSRRRDNIKWLLELKLDLKCIKCGEDHVSCLDFHHRDPSSKSFNISRAVLDGTSRKKIVEEINKCDVLCANCHRKHHWCDDESNILQRILLEEIQNGNINKGL